MTRRQFAIAFIFTLVAVIITAFCFEVVTRQHGPLLPAEFATPVTKYVFGIVCVLSTLAGTFFALCMRRWNPLLRLSMLSTPALLTLFDYYLLSDGDKSILYCLALLLVAALMLFYYTVMQD